MTFDDACQKEALIFQDILNFLEESGVSRQTVLSLQEQSSSAFIPLLQLQPAQATQMIHAKIDTLSFIQCYSRVYPYMNAQTLVAKLFDSYSILSEKCHIARQQLNRKIEALKDNVPFLAKLEGLKKEFEECLKLSNISFYKIRTLKNVYEGTSGSSNANIETM